MRVLSNKSELHGHSGRRFGSEVLTILLPVALAAVISAWLSLGQGAADAWISTSFAPEAGRLASNPVAERLTEDALHGLAAKVPPEALSRDVLGFLARGQDHDALNYLASQTGLSLGEAERRLEEIQPGLDDLAFRARAQAEDSVESAKWTLVLVTVGAAAGFGLRASRKRETPVGQRDLLRPAPLAENRAA